jgi:hypothetical protein
MNFNFHHNCGSITMSDGHVITADSPVDLMAHDLISSLRDNYAGASGILYIQFSKTSSKAAFVLHALPCAPSLRARFYETIAAAIYDHMNEGGHVAVRTPDKQWVQITSIVSINKPSLNCDEDVIEGATVSINAEPLQTEGLRDSF